MKAKIKRRILFVLIFFVITKLAGCYELIDSIKKFPIEEYKEFDGMDYIGKKFEEYILSGKLDFAKIEDIYILPFMKEYCEETTSILGLGVNAYTKQDIDGLVIDHLSLVDENGMVIFEESFPNNWKYYENESIPMGELKIWHLDFATEVTDDWGYHGNDLILNMQVSVQKGEQIITRDISFHAEIIQYRTSKWDL